MVGQAVLLSEDWSDDPTVAMFMEAVGFPVPQPVQPPAASQRRWPQRRLSSRQRQRQRQWQRRRLSSQRQRQRLWQRKHRLSAGLPWQRRRSRRQPGQCRSGTRSRPNLGCDWESELGGVWASVFLFDGGCPRQESAAAAKAAAAKAEATRAARMQAAVAKMKAVAKAPSLPCSSPVRGAFSLVACPWGSLACSPVRDASLAGRAVPLRGEGRHGPPQDAGPLREGPPPSLLNVNEVLSDSAAL